MNIDSRSILASLRGFSLCAIVAALVVSASPVTTAHAQGNSPTPTLPTGNLTPSFTQTPKPALTSTSRSVRSIPTPQLATRRIQENDAAAGYEIDVRYAAVNRPADVWLPFNALSEAQAREVITDFKTEVAAIGVVTQAAAPVSTLAAEWKAFRATRDFISIRSTYKRLHGRRSTSDLIYSRDQLRSAHGPEPRPGRLVPSWRGLSRRNLGLLRGSAATKGRAHLP